MWWVGERKKKVGTMDVLNFIDYKYILYNIYNTQTMLYDIFEKYLLMNF